MDKMYGDLSAFGHKEEKKKRISPEQYKKLKHERIMGKAAENFPSHAKQIKHSLEKAKGGMVGELKRTIRDKDLKRDHYADFKKQHNIK